MDPALQEHIRTDFGNDILEAIVKLADPKVAPAGMSIVARFGDIATCRLKVNDIKGIRSDEAVYSLKAPRLVGAEPSVEFLEESSSQQHKIVNNTEYTGKGVAIGVVDWGFDFTHPDFLNPDGTTRFRAIWDQTAPADPSSEKYGYGRVFSRQQINEALRTASPFETLGYHPASGDPDDSGSHATHVTSIAAGNGSAGEPGVATEADIIAVHLSAGKTGGLATLGDSVRILEAIDFIGQVAGGTPLVINLSVGKHGGAHQGNSLVEQGMDKFLKEKPGRAIVNSGGNYYSAKIHASGRVLPGGTASLHWETDRNDPTPNELEIWYSGKDRFRLKISLPGESTPEIVVDLGENRDIVIKGQIRGRAYHRANEPNTSDHHIDIFLFKNAPKGIWAIALEGADVVDGRYHAWIERDSGCRSCQSKFTDSDADPNYTTGSICNGLYSIAVGAYNNADPLRGPANFSSAGPTADGRKKPNLLAPGVSIRAARSSPAQAKRSVGEYTVKSGTSMAAPRVTGALALLFEAAGRPLPIEETRNLLLASLDPPPENMLDARASFRFGEGYLNIEKLVQAVQPVHSSSTQFAMKSNQYPGFEEEYSSEEMEYEAAPAIEAELDHLDLAWDSHEEDIAEYHEDSYEYHETEEGPFGADVAPEDFYDDYEEDSEESEIDEAAWEEDTLPSEETEHGDCGCGGKKPTRVPTHQGQHEDCRDCGEYLVEQAGEWMRSGGVGDFMEGFFARTSGLSESLALQGTGRSGATSLFDHIVFGKPLPFGEALLNRYKVVAMPRSKMNGFLLPGDMVLSRSMGDRKTWQALVLNGEVYSRQGAASKGLSLDSFRPGAYVEIVGVQPVLRQKEGRFGKRIGDEQGRLLPQYLIVRPISSEQLNGNLKASFDTDSILGKNQTGSISHLLNWADAVVTSTGNIVAEYTNKDINIILAKISKVQDKLLNWVKRTAKEEDSWNLQLEMYMKALLAMIIDSMYLQNIEAVRLLYTLEGPLKKAIFLYQYAFKVSLNPNQLTEREERAKGLFDDFSLEFLEYEKPPLLQSGPLAAKARGANVFITPKPDSIPFNFTGRYEAVCLPDKEDLKSLLGITLHINQAGYWVEGVLSFVQKPDNGKLIGP